MIYIEKMFNVLADRFIRIWWNIPHKNLKFESKNQNGDITELLCWKENYMSVCH